jgi:2-polyprenyl-3-methyl-5-hydroxy-6-metoxy-1,4-benzoquinol methylase
MKCPVCNSTDQKLLYPDTLGNNSPEFGHTFSQNHMRTYKIVKCLSCSHAFAILPDNKINYEDVIDPDYLKRNEAHLLTAQKVLQKLLTVKSSGVLLDVGCATGDFLSIAQDFYIVEGLELSKWSSDIAKQRCFKIHTCPLTELPDKKFDIITLWAVIEHFENPQQEIKKIYNLLNPDGIICIWTGNIDSLPSKILGKKWWYIQGQHIQYFSQKSLHKLLSDNNFKQIMMDTYPFTTNLNSLSKSFYRYNLMKPITQYLLENKIMRDKIITLKIPGEMLAIYKK